MTALPPQQMGQRSYLASSGRYSRWHREGLGHRAEDVKSSATGLQPRGDPSDTKLSFQPAQDCYSLFGNVFLPSFSICEYYPIF